MHSIQLKRLLSSCFSDNGLKRVMTVLDKAFLVSADVPKFAQVDVSNNVTKC